MARKRQFRINGLWSLMMLTFVCAVTAAGARYAYVAEQQDDTRSRGVFVIFSLNAPVVVLVFVSVWHRIYRLQRRHPNHPISQAVSRLMGPRQRKQHDRRAD